MCHLTNAFTVLKLVIGIFAYLVKVLEQRQQDELDEADLRVGLGDGVAVHEGREGQAAGLLGVALQRN